MGGGDRGAASSLYPGQAARGRVARSGGAKPEEAAHRQPDVTRTHLKSLKVIHTARITGQIYPILFENIGGSTDSGILMLPLNLSRKTSGRIWVLHDRMVDLDCLPSSTGISDQSF